MRHTKRTLPIVIVVMILLLGAAGALVLSQLENGVIEAQATPTELRMFSGAASVPSAAALSATELRVSQSELQYNATSRFSASAYPSFGMAYSWDNVQRAMTPGSQYTLTDLYTGSIFRMTYLSGENHAEMQFSSIWDLAIFETMGAETTDFIKRPVTVRVNGQLVSACMVVNESVEEDMADSTVCVYFSGSASNVGLLADAENEMYIRIACGEY